MLAACGGGAAGSSSQDAPTDTEATTSFFEEITGGALSADAVAQSLTGHIETLTAAVDALAAALVSS